MLVDGEEGEEEERTRAQEEEEAVSVLKVYPYCMHPPAQPCTFGDAGWNAGRLISSGSAIRQLPLPRHTVRPCPYFAGLCTRQRQRYLNGRD